jgi:hypothetical protein
MKFTTKTGRKVLGTLIAAAVMVSMIPAMVFAADPGVKTAVFSPTYTQPHDSDSFGGIIITASGGNFRKSNGGSNRYLEFNYNRKTATFTFAIDPNVYEGGQITKIEIAGYSATGIQSNSWGGSTWTAGANPTASVSLQLTKSNGGGNHRVTFSSITVYVTVPVTSVTLSDMYLFEDGDAAEMTVTLDPTNTTYTATDLTYTSSVESVATVAVSDGKVMVTPVGVGSTTITASLGSTSLGTATVTVYSPDEPVVTVNPSSLDLGLDSDPVTLTYTVIAPEDHEIVFLCFFVDEADEGVIEVDMETGEVTPVGVGTATVHAAIWDYTLDNWFEGTCTVTVSEVAPDPEVPFYTEEQLRAMSVQNFVEGMYGTILNRQFDAAGRDSWMNLILEQNGTATAVAIGFLESPEYTSYNVSDEEFVATCYRVFCNRAATAAETAQWVAQLEGGATRDSVIRQFAQSPEWANICAFFKVNV